MTEGLLIWFVGFFTGFLFRSALIMKTKMGFICPEYKRKAERKAKTK